MQNWKVRPLMALAMLAMVLAVSLPAMAQDDAVDLAEDAVEEALAAEGFDSGDFDTEAFCVDDDEDGLDSDEDGEDEDEDGDDDDDGVSDEEDDDDEDGLSDDEDDDDCDGEDEEVVVVVEFDEGVF